MILKDGCLGSECEYSKQFAKKELTENIASSLLKINASLWEIKEELKSLENDGVRLKIVIDKDVFKISASESHLHSEQVKTCD